MKKSIKTCCCLGLTLFLALSGTKEVNAADHCGTIKVACGGPVANVSIESHKVRDSSGNTMTCQRTEEKHFHTISCDGCGAVLKSNVVGTCLIKHTICPNEVGNCQNLR